MNRTADKPRIFHIPREDALEIHHSRFVSVGKIFSGEGVEAVWVKKQNEEIDPDWFCNRWWIFSLLCKGSSKWNLNAPIYLLACSSLAIF